MPNPKEDREDDVTQEGKLLSSQEREAFKMISTGKDLHGQRALALLAVDEGATQEEAAQRAGLTTGQVKYWLGKFRRVRLDIFPEQVINADQLAPNQGASEQGGQVTKKPKKSKAKQRKKKTPKKSKTKKGKKPKNKKGKDKTKKKGEGKKNKK